MTSVSCNFVMSCGEKKKGVWRKCAFRGEKVQNAGKKNMFLWITPSFSVSNENGMLDGFVRYLTRLVRLILLSLQASNEVGIVKNVPDELHIYIYIYVYTYNRCSLAWRWWRGSPRCTLGRAGQSLPRSRWGTCTARIWLRLYIYMYMSSLYIIYLASYLYIYIEEAQRMSNWVRYPRTAGGQAGSRQCGRRCRERVGRVGSIGGENCLHLNLHSYVYWDVV